MNDKSVEVEVLRLVVKINVIFIWQSKRRYLVLVCLRFFKRARSNDIQSLPFKYSMFFTRSRHFLNDQI